ncbi:30S ribosomal protein S18 [Caldithrix abyssi]|uniref:Small ribosomal subunit protein bS18 n=1 Tax=Caldithrix abyssi DSM 13497 TaxID=880073 RepID=H1XY90_CALAY|nr:30S ribosomal protein S18 [Caldithrix abyssi]APF17966.1 rpsR SSU ribosomal protein S18P [Caldithrix abyssi DSM 13497]EHO42017.1 30S ribosomal protein S18 [Caldithrix abyssi DSM 13497]
MLKFRRKRVCQFCQQGIVYIDFKDEKRLLKFLTEQGKIIPRHTSGTCAKHQRQLAKAIKRARHLALIPFVADFTR